VSNHARRRKPLDQSSYDPPPGLWKRTRLFVRWFFAPRALPEAWTAPRIYGSRYPKAREDGAGLRQVLDEARAKSDGAEHEHPPHSGAD
jgi:hypothetical protein